MTMQEYEAIPKYMKGRTQYQTLGTAVTELNTALESKYTFLSRPFASLPKPADKKRYKVMKSQETKDTRGLYFVTADDLKECALMKSEFNRRNLLTVLRHFQKIREIRGPGSIVRWTPVVKNGL